MLDADQLSHRLLAHAAMTPASASDEPLDVALMPQDGYDAVPEQEPPSLAHDLKAATAEAHEIVERAPGVDLLITGLIPKTLHTRYLICLWHIYATLEAALDVLSAHPALAPIYNPAALSRAAKLEDDIRYFLDLFDDSEDWKAHPEAQVDNWPKDTQDALKAYISRLQSLAAGQPLATNVLAQGQWDYAYPPPQPSQDLLLSHAYVRYMGDMSGGQEIRKSIAAAYSLPLDANDGQRFYEFGERGFDVREIKGMKRQFRTGLDKAGFEVSEQVYKDILQEANHTFELNIRLFSSFATSLPSDLSPAHSHSHQHPHHGQHASAAAGSGAKKGQCPFKHLQFAGQNTSRATQQGLRRLVSMSGSFQSALAALLVLALALLAYQLFASSA